METAAVPKKRPDFLTILCILSFIGSSFGILNNLSNFYNTDTVAEFTRRSIEEKKDEAMEEVKTSSQKALMERLFSSANDLMDTRKLKQTYLFSIMSNLLTLIGAILMYRLRKTGFGVYALGIGVSIVAPLVIFGFSSLIGLAATVFYILIGLIFLILYGLNLKHMR